MKKNLSLFVFLFLSFPVFSQKGLFSNNVVYSYRLGVGVNENEDVITSKVDIQGLTFGLDGVCHIVFKDGTQKDAKYSRGRSSKGGAGLKLANSLTFEMDGFSKVYYFDIINGKYLLRFHDEKGYSYFVQQE